MRRYVVASVAEVPPGTHRVFTVGGRPIGIFNLDGEFYGLLNRCPHQGGRLCDGLVTGLAVGDRPGEFRMIRKGEMVRCPWHGWEFDIRTGQSWCEPAKVRARAYPTEIAAGAEVVKGPYVAETVPVTVEQQYVVVKF
jgi:3-phenylpropionate/trans-cinnamate dioxygenase ferredoxin subunit